MPLHAQLYPAYLCLISFTELSYYSLFLSIVLNKLPINAYFSTWHIRSKQSWLTRVFLKMLKLVADTVSNQTPSNFINKLIHIPVSFAHYLSVIDNNWNIDALIKNKSHNWLTGTSHGPYEVHEIIPLTRHILELYFIAPAPYSPPLPHHSNQNLWKYDNLKGIG